MNETIKRVVKITLSLRAEQAKNGCIPDYVIYRLASETQLSDHMVRKIRDEVQSFRE